MQRGFRRLRHRRQLRSIGADVGDLVRNNQMVRGVDRTLYVVGDHAGAAPARCHRAAIGIGQRYLLVGRDEQCLFNRGQPFHFFFELRQLFLKPRLGQQNRFRRLIPCGSLTIGGVELAHVARHALFDLLLAALQLALREVVVATVHGLELAAIDDSDITSRQPGDVVNAIACVF